MANAFEGLFQSTSLIASLVEIGRVTTQLGPVCLEPTVPIGAG